MANTSNTTYLRFSAYSIKDLLTRKLAADTKFTDQVFEGSNLAILIDIVSYMYQCLMYNLNNAAAEAMWSDTQIYENINRLCKFIGYNPKGCSPSTVNFVFDNTDDDGELAYTGATILPYSCIDTNKTDSNGKRIYYSTISQNTIGNTEQQQVLFYNGLWKMYSTVFTGTGNAYQTLILDDIYSDDDQNKYVASEMIDVYVKEQTSQTYEKWQAVSQGIFTDNDPTNGSYIYNQNDKIYQVRLNEDKTYSIQFGNGSTGKNPPANSSIIIFYLDSNGPSGAIEAKDVQNAKIQHSQQLFGISKDLYTGIFGTILEDTNDEEIRNISLELLSAEKWTNVESSSASKVEESVQEIKRNAPDWFKIGNRLITTSDWEYFVKNCFRDDIYDVKCQNNWQYISTFYGWLYEIGKNGIFTKVTGSGNRASNPNYYVNQNRMIKYDFKFADAADSNNVYLWIKMYNDADIYKQIIDDEVQDIKAITQEPVYLKPLDVYFSFCAEDPVDAATKYFTSTDTSFDPDDMNYLEITMDNNSIYTTADIQKQVQQAILDFFNNSNFVLGQIVNYQDLVQKILNIGSISRIRTVYHNTVSNEERIINGISFATWSSEFIDIGDDLEVSSALRALQPFQFPKLYNQSGIGGKIKIIRKSMNSTNSIQY